jgi:hypothetical protein
MVSAAPGSEAAKITAARTLAFMASSEEHGSENRRVSGLEILKKFVIIFAY